MNTDSSRHISLAELRKHDRKDDCWIAVHSKVWDVTEFLHEHSGGPEIILQNAGTNATEAFDEVYAPGIFEENLSEDRFKSFLEPSSDVAPPGATMEVGEARKQKRSASADEVAGPPQLHALISAAHFETVAGQELTPKTWAFYSSTATDLSTHRQNKALLRRIMIQPRILRDVSKVDFRRKILGHDSAAPFFTSPAAMAKLAPPDGELALARAAGAEDIIQCVSNNASYPLSSIVESVDPKQPFFLQLYVNSERHKTADLLQKAKALGIKAIFVTVDAPVPGKREADERIAAVDIQSAISGAASSNDKKGGGLGRLMGQYIDKALTWSDLAWIKETSELPIVLKGVQSVADAEMALTYDVDAIFLSNHGGRSLDTKCLTVFSKMEVYMDGGFERGSDILKAIALGATAVGIGRPFLYSLVYGQDGVQHLISILEDEIEVSMRLCGLTSLGQATPDLLNTTDVDYLVRTKNLYPEIPGRKMRAKL